LFIFQTNSKGQIKNPNNHVQAMSAMQAANEDEEEM